MILNFKWSRFLGQSVYWSLSKRIERRYGKIRRIAGVLKCKARLRCLALVLRFYFYAHLLRLGVSPQTFIY